MPELWFALLVFTLVTFVVLDGWDMGAGALHFVVAKNDLERRAAITALGPLWSWHEVWLIAAGGTFLLAFPRVMAAAFSGFYLALWFVLWSFILRGLSVEVHHHIPDKLWQSFWDVIYAGSSALLAILFGAALGNVIRGVPLDDTGKFAMPLFTDFGVRGRVGILDWYTVSVALFSTILLAAHGATYLRLKTSGVVHQRSERIARMAWTVTAVLFPIVSFQTWIVRPELASAMRHRPVAWLCMFAIAGGVWAIWSGQRGIHERRALIGSSLVIVGLLTGAAAAIFPVLLHSTLGANYSLSIYNAAVDDRGLRLAALWWPVAIVLAITYAVIVMRNYRGKIAHSEGSSTLY
jgi:cytochrome bd ubiquinol oxidase subunit II